MLRLAPPLVLPSALSLACLSLSACAAFALPPSRSEIGTVVATRDAEPSVGLRLATGVHTASATTRESIPVDVGVGYLYEVSEAPRAPAAVALSDERVDLSQPESSRASHGAYLEVSRTVHRRDQRRLWLGLRTGVLFPDTGARDDVSTTVLARAGWELFTAGSGGGDLSGTCTVGGGVAHGAVAVGAYVESGLRRYLDGDAAFVASGGVTVRLPFLAGVAVDTCFKWVH